MNTCGFCAGRQRGVDQWWVGSTLKLSPGLAPDEFPVPTHPYACAYSWPRGTAPWNSHTGQSPGPAGSVESESMHILPWLLGVLRCSGELPSQHLPIPLVATSGTVHLHVPPWLLHPLGCSGKFLSQGPLGPTHEQGSVLAHLFPCGALGSCLAAPAYILVLPASQSTLWSC